MKSRGLTLSETGPRMCLHPIKIFAGAFGGAVLFEDDTFVSPKRAPESKKRRRRARRKVQKKQDRKAHKTMHALRAGDMDDLFKDDA